MVNYSIILITQFGMLLNRFASKFLKISLLLLIFSFKSVYAQETGYLTFDLNVDSVSVIINNDFFEARKIASTDSIPLKDGLHLVNISVPYDNYFVRYQRIKSGETSTIYHEFGKMPISKKVVFRNNAARHYFDSDVIIMSDSDSDIFVDDSLIGTGIAFFTQRAGIKSYTIKNPDFGTKSFDIIKTNSVFISLRDYYLRPEESTAKVLSFVPGASQFYKKQFKKGFLFSLSSAALAGLYFSKNLEYSDEETEFFELRKRYNNATNEELAFTLGNETEKQHDVIKKLDTQRKIFLGSALLLYAYNIFDGFTSSPKGGYRTKKPLGFYLGIDDELYGTVNKATFRINFKTK